MKCKNCKYYNETPYNNTCKLMFFDNFKAFIENECPFINNSYEKNKKIIEKYSW